MSNGHFDKVSLSAIEALVNQFCNQSGGRLVGPVEMDDKRNRLTALVRFGKRSSPQRLWFKLSARRMEDVSRTEENPVS